MELKWYIKFERVWKYHNEDEGLGRGDDDTYQEEMAELIAKNRGGYVAERGRTGKSHLAKLLKPKLEKLGYEVVDLNEKGEPVMIKP